eukprot:8000450-Ditylum_brightwellii.AAC.2
MEVQKSRCNQQCTGGKNGNPKKSVRKQSSKHRLGTKNCSHCQMTNHTDAEYNQYGYPKMKGGAGMTRIPETDTTMDETMAITTNINVL